MCAVQGREFWKKEALTFAYSVNDSLRHQTQGPVTNKCDSVNDTAVTDIAIPSDATPRSKILVNMIIVPQLVNRVPLKSHTVFSARAVCPYMSPCGHRDTNQHNAGTEIGLAWDTSLLTFTTAHLLSLT